MLLKFVNFFNSILRKSTISQLRKNFASGGESAIFYGRSLPVIRGEKNIELGAGVKFNEFAYLYARKNSKIKIGKQTTISSFAKLLTASYDLDQWIKELEPGFDTSKDIHVEKDIIIGNHCWIANNAIILPGVNLKDNVVVAAGSVVTKSFGESNIILGGVPAKIIKHLSPAK